MKADAVQQLSLLELASVDAEIARVGHRAGHLPEREQLDAIGVRHREANDRLAVLGITLEDIDGQVAKLESEVDAVRQREDRDRALLAGGTDAKQQGELQHELETLGRRQSSLEDELLDVMERREGVQADQDEQLGLIDELHGELSNAQERLDDALADLERAKHRAVSRREQLAAALDADLLALYERLRAKGGAGAGLLQAKRCGACRIEIDRGELARISSAPEDEVLRCPECGAILLRTKESGL